MPKYAVDISTWIYVDAENEEEAFTKAHAWFLDTIDDFEIVNVEEIVEDEHA